MYKLNSDILDIVKNDIFPEIMPGDVMINVPPKAELGDIAIGCFPLAKKLGLAPNIAAVKLAEALSAHKELIESAEVAGPYINVKLAKSYITGRLAAISLVPLVQKDKSILIDYFSANIGKPLHIGHLCSPSIGQSLMNAHKFLGYSTIGDNHLGDWGKQFGMIIYAFKKYGSREELEKNAVEHLFQLYVKITAECEADENVDIACREEFRKLSDADPENMQLWKDFTSYSLIRLGEFAATMDVYPDYAIGESFYEGLPLEKIGNHPDLQYDMKSVVAELIEKGVATKNEDGSVGVVFPEESKIPSCMLAKRDGTHGYLASDLAAIKYRLTNGWNPEKLVYCVDIRQALHFKQLFAIAKMAWPDLTKNTVFHHAANGFIKLKDGAMSTRKGTIVRLSDLFDEAFDRTKAILESKGASLSDADFRAIAVGAVKYSYLMQDIERDIVFDWDKALALEGHSGPYIQYAYVRAKNLIEKAVELGVSIGDKDIPANIDSFDRALFVELLRFTGAVEMSAEKYKPHHIALYAYELATKFSAFYVHAPKLLEEKDEALRAFRLELVVKTRDTLKKAFEILAIRMPEKM